MLTSDAIQLCILTSLPEAEARNSLHCLAIEVRLVVIITTHICRVADKKLSALVSE